MTISANTHRWTHFLCGKYGVPLNGLDFRGEDQPQCMADHLPSSGQKAALSSTVFSQDRENSKILTFEVPIL